LESSRDKLQEYVIKNREFYLKNSKWFLCDLDSVIQGHTNIIIWCATWSLRTFVWNIFHENALFLHKTANMVAETPDIDANIKINGVAFKQATQTRDW